MQRKRIARRCVLRQRRIPDNDLRRAGEVQPGSFQRGHVQRLTDMAGGVGPIRMLVEERAARGKIQQRGASQQRQSAAHNRSPENGYPPVHKRHFELSTLDEWKSQLVANRHSRKYMVFLTSQPFRPKLRLTKYMQANTQRIRILALLIAVIFLGAQFHYCCDLTAAPSASHICPVCSTAASVVATQSPVIAIVPVTNQLEVAPLVFSVLSAVPRDISPRAPPAL